MPTKIPNNKNLKDFIELVKSELKKYQGKLLLIPSGKIKSLEDGEFSEAEMIIKCFVDLSSNYWVGVLAHEYCHFLQCTSNSKVWNDFQDSVFSIKKYESIFNKKSSINKSKRKKVAKSIIKLELDCDKKAIKIIKKYSLPVDLKEYIVKANVILYKYLYWAEHGVWPDFKDKQTNKHPNYKLFKSKKLLHEEKYRFLKDIPAEILCYFEK